MIWEPWEDLVSAKVGLVTELSPQVRGAEEPVPPYLYTATLSHFDFRTVERQERLNAGKGRTEREAKLAALGEAVERYSAYHWDRGRTFLAKWADVRDAAIAPIECVLYADDQYARPDFPYRKWQADQEVTWISGIELPQRTEVALPASLVYLVHPLPRPEDYFAAITSNGLAAGASLDQAVLGGLYELIERDALLVTWMNRLPAIEIAVPDGGSAAAYVIRHYARFGVTVRAFALRTDQLPTVVMAIAFDSDPSMPARLIGMGCDVSPSAALDKAIFELCQARPSEAIRFRSNPPAGRLRTYEDVVTLEDHPAFHGVPEHCHETEFLWSTGEKIDLGAFVDPTAGQAQQNLDLCVARLAGTGHRVAYAEIAAPDVASVGYHVVRSFATGLQPIHFGWGEARLGGRRLFEAPLKWGLRPTATALVDINWCPHPLA